MHIPFTRASTIALALAGTIAFGFSAAAQSPGGPQETAGKGAPPTDAGTTGNAGASGEAGSQGPIGAGPQTMPAKFNADIAAHDRIPILARPLPLSDEQKKQIYSSIMNSPTATAEISAGPTVELPASVQMHELPAGLAAQIPAMQGYKYVKLADKVLLVAPSNRVVVGEIER